MKEEEAKEYYSKNLRTKCFNNFKKFKHKAINAK